MKTLDFSESCGVIRNAVKYPAGVFPREHLSLPTMAEVPPFLVRYAASLQVKSRAVTAFLQHNMGWIGAVWLLAIAALSAMRLATPAAPIHKLGDAYVELAGYGLIMLAPVLGYMVARQASRSASFHAQARFRLPWPGKWRDLHPEEARAMPVFGAVGFMASLLVGLLLNVVIRTMEFYAAVPAMGAHAPAWGRALFSLMAADLVLTSFMYTVAFVMALRAIPLFPRMLLFVWLLDIMLQMAIARQIGQMGGVPPQVAEPLAALLDGNITKVLISILVWLPYLLLSERVNVTYRHRTNRAADAVEPGG